MEPVSVAIKKVDGGNVVITAYPLIIGSVNDKIARKFVFERPDEFTGDNLVVYVSKTAPINLGTGNELPIYGELASKPELELQIAFESDGNQLTLSNTITLEFRASLMATRESISADDWSRIIGDIDSGALYEVDVDSAAGVVRFLNRHGDERAAIPSLGGTFNGDANDVTYGDTTVADALSEALAAIAELSYVPVVITSMTGGSVNEVGSTVASVTLAWTVVPEGEVTSQSVNNGIGDISPTVRTYTHYGQTITANRTYTLTVDDGKTTVTASTTVSFQHKRYWGVSASDALTDEQIIALSSEFATGRTKNMTFDATGGRYIYYAYPAAWGAAPFKVGGFAYSGMELTTRNFVNASGNTTLYNIYRMPLQTGSGIVMEVS